MGSSRRVLVVVALLVSACTSSDGTSCDLTRANKWSSGPHAGLRESASEAGLNGGLTHSTPFDCTQDVPLFLYGPGYVRPGLYERPITLADFAPTEGAILKYDFPAVSGAFMIDFNKIDSLLRRAFDDDGVPLIEKVRATEIWLNTGELADNGFTLNDVSRLIMGLTQAQTHKRGTTAAPGREHDPVFSAAFRSSMLSRLPCLPEARAS